MALLFLRPEQTTQRQYGTLLALQTELVDNVLKPGKTGAEVYSEAVEFMKKKDAKLAESMPKTLGFAVSCLSRFFEVWFSTFVFSKFVSNRQVDL